MSRATHEVTGTHDTETSVRTVRTTARGDSAGQADRRGDAARGATAAPIHVLLVEDDEDDYVATRVMLEDAERITVELRWAESVGRAQELIETETFDVILVDHRLGPDTGLDFVRAAAHVGVRGPFILLTGIHDGRIDDEALDAGVADYLVKGNITPSRLERSIRYTLHQAQLVDELRRARELKDQFLSHISHELRTPIAAVHQFVSILLDGLAGDLKEQQSEYLEIVLRNVTQLAKMVDDLLEATRAQTGKLRVDPVRVSASAMIDAVRAEYQQRAVEAQVTLVTECPSGLTVRADPARTHQVLSNLLDNALRYTPAGGTITITAQHASNADAVLSVVDSGIGMDADASKVIFRRHGQIDGPTTRANSRRGLGLGLFICRQLVELQGGNIWVDSKVGEGSAFHFSLPLWSLTALVEPAVTRMVDTGGALVVVRVGLSHRGTSPSRRRDILALTQRVIDDFTLPYDVVLPTADTSDHAVYLLAPVAERNVAPLTARISRELERHPRLANLGLTWSMSCSALAFADVDATSADNLPATVARQLEDLLAAPEDVAWSPVDRTANGQPQGIDRR